MAHGPSFSSVLECNHKMILKADRVCGVRLKVKPGTYSTWYHTAVVVFRHVLSGTKQPSIGMACTPAPLLHDTRAFNKFVVYSCYYLRRLCFVPCVFFLTLDWALLYAMYSYVHIICTTSVRVTLVGARRRGLRARRRDPKAASTKCNSS